MKHASGSRGEVPRKRVHAHVHLVQLNVLRSGGSMGCALRRHRPTERVCRQICVRHALTGQVSVFDVEASDTVNTVKRRITDAEGLSSDRVGLWFGDVLLDDVCTLSDLNIGEGVLLRLCLRPNRESGMVDTRLWHAPRDGRAWHGTAACHHLYGAAETCPLDRCPRCGRHGITHTGCVTILACSGPDGSNRLWHTDALCPVLGRRRRRNLHACAACLAGGWQDQVYVKLPDGSSIMIDASGQDSIHTLKGRIEEETSIAIQHQRLFFDGQALDDGCAVKECGVAWLSELQLAVVAT